MYDEEKTEVNLDAFEEGPEFWFDKDGKIWFGHDCVDGAKEYTLVRAIYDVVSTMPLTIRNPVRCKLCGLDGKIADGQWVEAD